jgi:hypothetical protein
MRVAIRDVSVELHARLNAAGQRRARDTACEFGLRLRLMGVVAARVIILDFCTAANAFEGR